MDDDLDPPSNLNPSSAPPLPSFMCPIGHEIMCDPVSCADGHSYEQGRQAGLEIGRRVQIVLHDSFTGAFAKDGAPNEVQKEESFWGMWAVAFDP
jgi:hypothetical protein